MAEPTRRPAEQYRRAWRQATRPNLQAFITTLPSLTLDQLVDLIEVDQAERWLRGDRVPAEEYLNAFPSIQRQPESAIIIIYGEFFIRTERNEHPSLAEYMNRFPKFARRLREQVQWHEAIDLEPVQETPVAWPAFPNYQCVAFAGRGGACCVYEAVDHTGQSVAIKVLDAVHRQDEAKNERFRREAEAGLRLRHPNIVPTYSIGESESGPYLVLEFCHGGSLASALRSAPWPLADIPCLLGSIAHAVEYAHQAGIIHRDLKPSNILLTADRVAKVADFGLAKVLGSGSITATGEILGTPCYMAPEQTLGTHDSTTDVYALGAILYECLTGRPPFVHAAPMEVLRMIREESPVPPSQFNTAIPPKLEAVCLTCLNKDPADRYPSALAVSEELARI